MNITAVDLLGLGFNFGRSRGRLSFTIERVENVRPEVVTSPIRKDEGRSRDLGLGHPGKQFAPSCIFIQVEYLVMRLYEGGVRVEKRVRQVKQCRGHLSISIEKNGRRSLLVARLQPAVGQSAIPPLFEAALLGTSSECWVLSGHERVEAGPLRKECLLGQTWLVEPAYGDDLIRAEQNWTLALLEAGKLREQLSQVQIAGTAAVHAPESFSTISTSNATN
jgi:hypothetical protein